MTLGLFFAALVEIYLAAIIIRVVASWIPGAKERRPIQMLGKVTDPFLKLFRFIPPIGGMDVSPILAIFLLQLLANWLRGLGF